MKKSILKKEKLEQLRSTIAFSNRNQLRTETSISPKMRYDTDLSFFQRKQKNTQLTLIDNKTFTTGFRKNAFVSHRNTYDEECELIKKQILQRQDINQYICETLKNILSIIGRINTNLFSYPLFQQEVKQLLFIIKKTRSGSLYFRLCLFIGQCSFQYGNYSLSICYFTKALKTLYQQGISHKIDRMHEIVIYKTVTKIFMQKNMYFQAREMAYKCLRKCWMVKYADGQLQLYDILGQIEHQCNNFLLSKYFHYRMCSGIFEGMQLIKMSNYEIEKDQKVNEQFFIVEDISHFIKNDSQFNQILSKHYISESFEYAKKINKQNLFENGINNKKKYKIYITHRSPNRVIRNYHSFQKKRLNENEKSKELYFIGERQCKNIKKLNVQFGRMIFNLKSSFKQKKRFVTQIENEDDFNEFEQVGYKYLRG